MEVLKSVLKSDKGKGGAAQAADNQGFVSANAAAASCQSTPTIFFTNELSIEADGWAMIAPFGDYPSEALLPTWDGKLKRQRAIQRITRESAEGMVAQFHNSRAGLKKFIRGCNIYVGHPDMPGLESRYPDKEPKGVFADMEVRAGSAGGKGGVYGLPVFTSEGMELVEGRKLVNGQRVRGFSGRLVEATPDGEALADGQRVPVFVPTKIASAGLTAFPHLPVEFFNEENFLVNHEIHKKHENNMKNKVIALLATLTLKPQFANTDEPTEAELEAALDQIEEKVSTTLASITAERDEARRQFTNERAERIADEIDRAITGGRITDAEKATWGKRLEAQFTNEVTAIRGLAPKIKTSSVTISRGQRRDQIDLANPRQRQQFVNELLVEIAAEQRLDPVRHSKRILNLARERHPVLFEVPFVEIRTPGKQKN